MNFIKVDSIPKCTPRRYMDAYLKEFMHMNIKMVRVENHKYKTPRVAANCLAAACRRHVFPIDVRMSNGEVYLIRRDM